MAASVLVALAGTVAVLAVETRANGRLQQANSELTIANGRVAEANAELKSANGREKQRFSLAVDAIKLFHGEVSEDLLLKEKRFEGLRTRLLKGPADFYGRLEGLLKDQSDRESRAALGHAYDELGDLTAKIGDQPAALSVHRKALVSAPGAGIRGRGGCRDEARRRAEPVCRRSVAESDRRHGRSAGVVRGGAASGGGPREIRRRGRTGLEGAGKSLRRDRRGAVRDKRPRRSVDRLEPSAGHPAEAG